MRRNQVMLFNNLRKNFIIQRGYLMENDGKYHEKGVDVQMAVDMLIGAYENKYDVAIVLSSDTDLIPAMEKVKELGKRVEYIGFGHQPSYGMQRSATLSYLLLKEDLAKFIRQT